MASAAVPASATTENAGAPFEQRDEPLADDLMVVHDEEPENRGEGRLDQGWHLS
jgi:hypothetical protein